MGIYVTIAQIIISIALMVLILMQTKSSGGLGGIFGSDGSFFRTRRGVEKTLFIATIVLSILFLVVSLVSAIMGA